MKVETWVANFKDDFNIHDSVPIRNNVKWLKSDRLSPNSVV